MLGEDPAAVLQIVVIINANKTWSCIPLGYLSSTLSSRKDLSAEMFPHFSSAWLWIMWLLLTYSSWLYGYELAKKWEGGSFFTGLRFSLSPAIVSSDHSNDMTICKVETLVATVINVLPLLLCKPKLSYLVS